ncbi:MAG: PhnD/SsuA/transferrin family substrate-binding protein, partial [Rhizobiaceae bacterium]
ASLQALLSGLRLAYNVADSMSGYIALERDLQAQGSGLDIFSECVMSGGHRKSIRMVAAGEADVAAVDCKSWALAQSHEPAARALAVVGWTEKRKGLPFVTARR